MEHRASLDGGGDRGRDWNEGEEDVVRVGLSPAERRERKARARTARLEETRLKKETAARDARLAALDKQDDFKGFGVKVPLCVCVMLTRSYYLTGRHVVVVPGCGCFEGSTNDLGVTRLAVNGTIATTCRTWSTIE